MNPLPVVGTYVLRRIIWRPADKSDLAPGALSAFELVLDVEHGVATANALLALAVLALGVEQLLAEDVKVGLLGSLLDDNLFPVVADLVDNPFDVLAKLELVEGADALGRDGDTASWLVRVGAIEGCAMRVSGWWWRQGKLCGRGRRAATAVDALLFVLQYVPGLSLYPLLVRVP